MSFRIVYFLLIAIVTQSGLADNLTPVNTNTSKPEDTQTDTTKVEPEKTPSTTTENATTDKTPKTAVEPNPAPESTPPIKTTVEVENKKAEQAKIEAEKARIAAEQKEAENQRIIFKITSEMSSDVLGKFEESDRNKIAVEKEKAVDDKLRAYQSQ